MSLEELINKVRSEIGERDERIRRQGESYGEMYKALAKIKIELDRALRQRPEGLVGAVMDAVDLARGLTPYFDYSKGKNVLDNVYSDEERNKIASGCLVVRPEGAMGGPDAG